MEYKVPSLWGYEPPSDIETALREQGAAVYAAIQAPAGSAAHKAALDRLTELAAFAAYEEAASAVATGGARGLSFADAAAAALAELPAAVARLDLRSHTNVWDWCRPAARRAINDAGAKWSGKSKREAEDTAAVLRLRDAEGLAPAEMAAQLGWPLERVEEALESSLSTFSIPFGWSDPADKSEDHDGDEDHDGEEGLGPEPAYDPQELTAGDAGEVAQAILERLNAAEEGLGDLLARFFGIGEEAPEGIAAIAGDPRYEGIVREAITRGVKYARAIAAGSK